ncbi:MAG: plastocyanin/azurin family copper-binding protein [Deltaproteobacteria bacterium]|nr:plastocyanin/azurin family copper-binding protein [Deltaproteobacteria bacterium]
MVMALLAALCALAVTHTACGGDDDDDDDNDDASDDDAADDDMDDDDDADDDVDDDADDDADDDVDDDADDDADDDDDDDDTAGPQTVDVSIVGMTMVPDPVTIAVGDTVRWTNNDLVGHTTTSGSPGAPDGTWDSGNLSNGDDFEFLFEAAGTYTYYCKNHSGTMNGYQIIVTE